MPSGPTSPLPPCTSWGRAHSEPTRGRSSSCRPMPGTWQEPRPSAIAPAGAIGRRCPWTISARNPTWRSPASTRFPRSSARRGPGASQEDRNVLEAPGGLRTLRISLVAGLLLGESLPLHVAPDLLRHLGEADGRRAHHGLHGVLATLEVDRVAAKRQLLLRHAVYPPSSGCGIRRPAPPVGPRVLSPGPEGAQGKNTLRRGPPTTWRYRVGVYPPRVSFAICGP